MCSELNTSIASTGDILALLIPAVNANGRLVTVSIYFWIAGMTLTMHLFFYNELRLLLPGESRVAEGRCDGSLLNYSWCQTFGVSGVSVRRRPCGGKGSSDRCQANFVYALQEVGPRADLPFAARAHLTWVTFA